MPSFVDPQQQIEVPDLGPGRTLRFLTSDDFPPFNFTAPDGTLTGFNIDLARAVCGVLKVACTIQARSFDSLVPSLKAGAGDAVAASLKMTEASRAEVDFSLPTMKMPARFAARLGTPVASVDPEAVARLVIGVQQATAHEAYLRAFYPRAILKLYPDPGSLRSALRTGDVDVMFADGLATALWLNGVAAEGCCAFVGGPLTESRFFGDGTGLAVRKGDVALRQAFDYALTRLAAEGVTADLYLKYFPIGFY